MSINQIKILIACPGDVDYIKDYIKKHCAELNKNLVQNEDIESSIIDWKTNAEG